MAWAADVSDRDRLDAVVDEVAGAFGGIDVVLANAGVAPPTGTILSVDADTWERVLEINLGGVYRTVKATLPHVVARGGHVLVVASVYAFANGVLASPYAVSKAGVEALGRALRAELGPHGATAGVAYFGFIDTRLVRDAFEDPITQGLREGLPGFISRPLPVGRAGAAVVRGLERRSARVRRPAGSRPCRSCAACSRSHWTGGWATTSASGPPWPPRTPRSRPARPRRS